VGQAVGIHRDGRVAQAVSVGGHHGGLAGSGLPVDAVERQAGLVGGDGEQGALGQFPERSGGHLESLVPFENGESREFASVHARQTARESAFGAQDQMPILDGEFDREVGKLAHDVQEGACGDHDVAGDPEVDGDGDPHSQIQVGRGDAQLAFGSGEEEILQDGQGALARYGVAADLQSLEQGGLGDSELHGLRILDISRPTEDPQCPSMTGGLLAWRS